MQLVCNYKIYPIYFVIHLNIVDYIKKCTLNVQKTQMTLKINKIWDESFEKGQHYGMNLRLF